MNRWRKALDKLWQRHRVHCGPDMSLAYRELSHFYENCQIHGFESGAKSGSWTAPNAWIVEHARLTDPAGQVVADFEHNPLHLFSFSPPFSGKLSRDQLDQHLFSVAVAPDRIPFHFRNQYRHWAPEWGFCISHNARTSLIDGDYTVDIATRFEPGVMEMVEQVHEGEHEDTVLLVGHFDHPHMCNDGLVGCLAGHEALTALSGKSTKLTYRMLSTVEIVGSVFYAADLAPAANVREALFVATAGAAAPVVYQTSFSGNSVIDRVMRHILDTSLFESTEHGFRQGPLGNDEVAFDVSGINIPCGSIMRAPFDTYHTDLDTPENVLDTNFDEIVSLLGRVINILERNCQLERKFDGLPCLSSPELDLYLSPPLMSQVKQETLSENLFGGLPSDMYQVVKQRSDRLNYMMNVLPAMCDSTSTLLDLAEKTGLPFELVDLYTDRWVEKGLLSKEWVHPFIK